LRKDGDALSLEKKFKNQATFFPFTWLRNYGIDNSDFLMNLDHGLE